MTFLNTELSHTALCTGYLTADAYVADSSEEFPCPVTHMKASQTIQGVALCKTYLNLIVNLPSGYEAHSVEPHRKADLWSCALALRLTPDHKPTCHRGAVSPDVTKPSSSERVCPPMTLYLYIPLVSSCIKHFIDIT